MRAVSRPHSAMRVGRAACLVLALAACAHALVDDVIDVIKLGKEIGEEVLSSWDIIGKNFNSTGGVELPIIHRRERLIVARMQEVTRAIQRLELEVEKAGAVAMFLAKNRGRGTRVELRLHDMADLLGRVSYNNRVMLDYVGLQEELERNTLQDFAEWCVSHEPTALPGLMERVHALVVPPHKHLLGRGLLQMIIEDLQDQDSDICELQMSPHQLIYDMYNTIALTEIKGYAMMQFSWMLLRIYGKGNYTQEASLTRQRYSERTRQAAAAARAALLMANRGLYRCDPPHHEEGVTYEQVTRLLQGYVENEVEMNPDGTCRENCAFYTLAKKNKGCFKDMYCSKQKVCNGRIIGCDYIDSDMWICPASETSTRRYEWIEYENGRQLGKHDGSCRRGTDKVDSWWKWNLVHCSYCMCLCEEDASDAERSFSLREANADIERGKVVTGIRMVKHRKVFHLQIHQGTLGERGVVEAGEWVPIQKFDPTDDDIMEGMDYHSLSYEKRAIDLDELDSPAGHVLTGVRFRMLGAHLHFEIRSTPFNYSTGRLFPSKSQWISNDNTEGNVEAPRRKLELVKPDIPTRSGTPQHVDSEHDQYVEFTHTDFDADAAQSTVPFIDIQPVVATKGGSLSSGAGLIHRGGRGSGGFLSLKLLTYDLSKHVKAEPPPTEFAEDTTEFMPVIN